MASADVASVKAKAVIAINLIMFLSHLYQGVLVTQAFHTLRNVVTPIGVPISLVAPELK
jgi:hypothetical protein